MPQQWFAQVDGMTAGPFEMRRLRELAAEGKLTAETPVRLGEDVWKRAGQVDGLFGLTDPALSAVGPGSSHGFTIDPSMNDTTEWRMLAETAPTPKAEETKPLPRRVTESPVRDRGPKPPARLADARTLIIIAAGIFAMIGVVAVVALTLMR